MAQQLKVDYAHLAESMIMDVLRTEPDYQKARVILASIQSSEPEQKQIDRMVEDLKEFHDELGRETIIKCLKENNWQVENALVPLFALVEEKREQVKREAAKKRKAEAEEKARIQANKFLKDLFTAVSEDKIQKLLVDMDGDVDACIEELLRIQEAHKARADQREKEQELARQREEQIGSLAYKFNKSKPEVAAVLETHKWNLEKAVEVLLKEVQEAKLAKLCKVFPNRDPVQIQAALEIHDYDEFLTRRSIEDLMSKEDRVQKAKIAEEAARVLALKKAKDAQRLAELATLAKAKAEAKEAEIKAAEALVAEQERLVAVEDHRRKMEEQAKIIQITEGATMKPITPEAKEKADLARTQFIIQYVNPQKETMNYVFTTLEEYIRRPGAPDSPVNNNTAPTETPVQNISPVQSSPTSTNNEILVQDVTLTTSVSACDHSEPIIVTWTLPTTDTPGVNSPGGPNDWIGIFREGAQNRNYTYYIWTSANKDGQATFTAPTGPGTYEFRYFVNRTYTLVGSSKPIVVGPVFLLTPTVGEKNQVKINVKQTFGKPCPAAWIGLYDPAKANNAYVCYQNVGDKQDILFTVPKAGVWEFRLFPQRAYDHVAACKVDVNGDTKLTLSVEGGELVVTYNVSTLDPKVDRTWFGIYHTNETNSRNYRRFQYITDTASQRRMKLMKTQGTYEARLFAHGTTTVICTSNQVTVANE